MSVISVSIPVQNESRFGISLLKYGVSMEAMVIDRIEGEDRLFIDIPGDADKILRACLGMNAEILDCIPQVERDNVKHY